MIQPLSIVRAGVIAAALVLAACSSKPEGKYFADFSSSDDPNVALAAALMKMSLDFSGDQVVMEISALGNSEQMEVEAEYKGDTIVLTKPDDPKKEEMVLTVKDSDTLECKDCPSGMPTVWRKQQ